MIEVIPADDGWKWRMICAAGRTLAYSLGSFGSDFAAFADANVSGLSLGQRREGR